MMENAIGAEETLFNGNTAQYGASMGAKATTTTSFAQGNLAGTGSAIRSRNPRQWLFLGSGPNRSIAAESEQGNFHLK